MNTTDVIASFTAAALRRGLEITNPIADGRIHRCAVEGARRGKRDGSYLLHLDDHPAGIIINWKDGQGRENWRYANGSGTTGWTAAERAAFDAKVAARKKADAEESRRLKAAAAGTAVAMYGNADLANPAHPYLARKQVKPHGIRQRGNELLVPRHDMRTGELVNLQKIPPNGDKLNLENGRVDDTWFIIGKPQPTGTIQVGEGYATCATAHEVTGHAAVVSFGSGNLEAAAVELRRQYPGAKIGILADDDWKKRGNPGLTAAKAAALASDAILSVPKFGPDREDGDTDLNDLFRLAGAEAVREVIDNASAPSLDWPQPGPVVAELKPVPKFDAETLLPDVLRAWVMDEAERMPCPPEFIAAAAMVALGSVIGARCAIKPKARDPWLIVPNLWGGIVGDPSDKKSPAWGAALRPLDALIAKASEAHRQALAEYETERVVFEARKDAIEGRIKEAAKKPSTGDPVVIAKELRTHTDGAPKAPALRRYKTNDSTVEKLGELLRDTPAGLLVLRDELVGLIANWDREGREGERAFFLEAWNGDQAFDTDRIGRGHISIANLCVGVFGGVQPDKLVVYLEQAAHALANDGMLQRFQLLVYPDPCPWEWRDRLPDKKARDAAYDVFDKLAEFDPVAWGASAADEMAKFPWFRFGDEAQAVFIEWSEDLHRVRMPAEDDPIIRQHLAKYDKLFPALALILHLVNRAAGGRNGPVSYEAALRASAWCEFLEAHAERCYGLLKDDGLRAAQALAAKLEGNKLEDGFTLRDVRRNQWRSLTTDETIQAALDWLEDEDWLRSESTGGTGPGTGRRTVSYKINPEIARKGKGEGA